MSQIRTLISHEYRMDIKAKSFWISTFIVPLLIILFGVFIGYLNSESDALQSFGKATSPDVSDDITGRQAIAMVCGTFLTLFVIMFGAQIFNKVKTEKCNRIVEVIVSCVPGRNIMFAKVISVGLLGLTQLLIWAVIVGTIFAGVLMVLPVKPDISILFSAESLWVLFLFLAYFIGGFIFYGSLFAMAGAVTDRNNENQGYLSVIMMLLMVSFYLGIFAVDKFGTPLATICFYLPFTSTTIGAVGSISGDAKLWETFLSLAILGASAFFALMIAGKCYTSSLLLKGKKFTPKDIIVFLRSK